MGALRSLQRFQAIRVVTVEGVGTIEDPYREVTYIFDERDSRISRSDPCEPSIQFSRAEIGLAIDGIATTVDGEHRDAAPLLRKLQLAYADSKTTA